VAGLSFELEKDLRLLPQKMELGSLELLTNSIKLPFDTLQKQLESYGRHPNHRLRDELRRDIKRYLGRLNANPLFPLSFRLNVLDSFEKHTDLFDVELSAQVLNAYKIGIQLVQKHALKHPEYWPILIRIVSKTLELAEILLFDTLKTHHAQHVIALRQSLDLMRLGLLVAQNEGKSATQDIALLHRAVAAHELLRCMDMHAHTDEEQMLIRKELKHFCDRVKPVLFAGDEPMPRDLDLYLITATHEPHHLPYKVMKLPEKADKDMILMPLGPFLEGIKHDIKMAKAAADLPEDERDSVMSKARFHEVMQGAVHIPRALQTISRKHTREIAEGVRVLVDFDIKPAFSSYSDSGMPLGGDMLSPAERREAWAVRNVSAGGIMIEGLTHEPLPLVVGQLVGVRWIDRRLGTDVGFVKWFRDDRPGEHHVGIKFLGSSLKPTRGAVLQSRAVQLPTSMHFLHNPAFPKEILVPLAGIEAGDKLRFQFEGDELQCHVTLVLRQGSNFSYCCIAMDGLAKATAASSLSI